MHGKLKTWGQEQRFQHIEYRAYWAGCLNRVDLVERFGVSVPQASNDLKAYQSRHPGNLRYDHAQRRYYPTAEFSPAYTSDDPHTFLMAEAASVSGDVPGPAVLVNADMLQAPSRHIDPDVLRQLVSAACNEGSVAIDYHSMNVLSAGRVRRRISPHSFASDAMRWHVRAYCHEDEKFKDFVISRMTWAGESGDAAVAADKDHGWNCTFTVVLVPNPDLTADQQAIVAQDYGMTDGRIELEVRQAMLYYFDKRFRFDVASDLDRPAERPVMIQNNQDYQAALIRNTA